MAELAAGGERTPHTIRLGLSFEENRGQAPGSARFLARGRGYNLVHYRVHFSLAGSGLVAWQRQTHFYHHFTNNKRCFGVTSPFWDYVFRTMRPIS